MSEPRSDEATDVRVGTYIDVCNRLVAASQRAHAAEARLREVEKVCAGWERHVQISDSYEAPIYDALADQLRAALVSPTASDNKEDRDE